MIVAVVGATGVVGREMLRTLEARKFPATKVIALSSRRSAGSRILYMGVEIEVREATPDAFEGVTIALMSAGAAASRSSPEAAKRGAVVIDNSSAWRMDPEVHASRAGGEHGRRQAAPEGIIANTNCSTIQMVVALKPLHDAARIKHIVVSTYQAASGKGHAAVEDLHEQTRMIARGERPVPTVFPSQLAHNVVMDWKAGQFDYSEEEMKMVHETQKIFEDDSIGVSPTTVRVAGRHRSLGGRARAVPAADERCRGEGAPEARPWRAPLRRALRARQPPAADRLRRDR